jgi:hypothetical protein
MAGSTAPQGASPARTVFTVVMDVLVAVALIALTALVFGFFGQLLAQPWGRQIYTLAGRAVIDFGIAPIATPYGGTFSLNAVVSILLYVVVEWALGMVRRSR